MPTIDFDAYLSDEVEGAAAQRFHRNKRRLGRQEKRFQLLAEMAQHVDKTPLELQQGFNPSFRPSEHERFWLLNYLEPFYNQQLISDVLWKVKGGKEANVYGCTAHPATGLGLIAAKVYRPQMFRNLRNDAQYRQGREVVDKEGKAARSRREALALAKNTRFGQELRHASWLQAEYDTLQLLHEAGAHVPRPLAHGNNVILMEYIGSDGAAAPALQQVNLDPAAAQRAFDLLLDDLAIMLACHRVHADLSAYNVLYWQGQVKIIDFPQAVDPRRNADGEALFGRDVERICQYFARQGIARDARALANELWQRFEPIKRLDADVDREPGEEQQQGEAGA